jgi:dienelactone hydrolase
MVDSLEWIRQLFQRMIPLRWPYRQSLVLCLLIVQTLTVLATPRNGTGPWNLRSLRQTPTSTLGTKTEWVQEVYYTGEPFQGKPTRVFAYLGRPTSGKGPFPAMLLVHGGGGKAFKEWAEYWAKRGYVALAMDTAGNGPNGRLADGGPDQNDDVKFREFEENEARDMWTYHPVAAVIRGHSLLASLPEVDAHRIGITGISWGGYLTCLVAGLDDRLKVAVPVYGCGFLGDNSVWKSSRLDNKSTTSRERWLRLFDPGQYLDGTECPILFLNGSNDFAYPLDSYQKSYQRVRRSLRTVSVVVKLPHGHIWTFPEVDHFVDNILRRHVAPLPQVSPIRQTHDSLSVRVKSKLPLSGAALHYAVDSGAWQGREWKTLPATIGKGVVSAVIPSDRPIACYLSITNQLKLRVSSEHVILH